LVRIQQVKSGALQHRYSIFDALGRLTYERQPEADGYFTQADSLTGNNSWSPEQAYEGGDTSWGDGIPETPLTYDFDKIGHMRQSAQAIASVPFRL
jgi:hypothetical protein